MKRAFIYCLFLLCMLFSGCEKADEWTMSPRENFETLWTILDEHYCFFEYKNIDWNEVHDRYSLQITETMDQFELFDVLSKMLAELKDGHTNLISPFNLSRYWAWYEDYPPNFYLDIQKRYLGRGYGIAGGIEYCKLANEEIGYLYYGSFSDEVGEGNLDYVFLHFKDCKGLIIDVRDNGGGALTNSDRIVARFMQEKMITGYIQHKTGVGHDDFSEPYPVELSPAMNNIRWLRPVIVLTNRHCYSAANDFVQKMKMMPHVKILGDRTGGGTGFPFSSELPIGWSVRFSASPMLDANRQQTEFGIDPDIQVSITQEDMMKGRDTLIDEAVKRLLEETKE